MKLINQYIFEALSKDKKPDNRIDLSNAYNVRKL